MVEIRVGDIDSKGTNGGTEYINESTPTQQEHGTMFGQTKRYTCLPILLILLTSINPMTVVMPYAGF